MTEITTVRPETSWAFPDSYTADNSGNECSSTGGLSWEVQRKSLCFCPFLRNTRASTSSGSTVPTYHVPQQQSIGLSCTNNYFIWRIWID